MWINVDSTISQTHLSLLGKGRHVYTTIFKPIRSQSLTSERLVRESVAGKSVFVLCLTTWDVSSLPADLSPKSLAANSAGSRFSLIRSHSKEQKTVYGLISTGVHSRGIIIQSDWLLCWLLNKSLSYCLTLTLSNSLYTHSLQLQDLLYMNGVNVRQYTSIHPSHLWSSLCSAAPVE